MLRLRSQLLFGWLQRLQCFSSFPQPLIDAVAKLCNPELSGRANLAEAIIIMADCIDDEDIRAVIKMAPKEAELFMRGEITVRIKFYVDEFCVDFCDLT